MEEKEHQAEKKTNIGKFLFIPLAIVIIGIFVLMHLRSFSGIDHSSARIEDSITAPNFTLADLDGQSVSLEDFRGKVVLLNVWATWCPPCVSETPSLEKLYNRFKNDDFKLLAVSVDEDGRNVILPFMEKRNLTFPVLVDSKGTIMKSYGITGVPESFIIRKDGIIEGKIEGAIDWMSPDVIEYISDLIEK